MAGNHVAPIFPGNGPAGGVTTAPVVAPPSGVGDLGQLPGLLLAMRQMEQSRKENQRDREHQLLLTQKQLDAGAALRAAQADNQSAAAALSRAQIGDIEKFRDINARILDEQSKVWKARASQATTDAEEYSGNAENRKKLRANEVNLAELNTKTAKTNFDTALEGLEGQKAQNFRTAVSALGNSLTRAAIDIGTVSHQAHDKALETAYGEAYRTARERMLMQPRGREYADKWATGLEGEGMARYLTDTPTVGSMIDPKLGVFDPVRLAGAMVFQSDLDTQGVSRDVSASQTSAQRVMSMDPLALQTAEYASFTKNDNGQNVSAPNDPNKPDGPTFSSEAIHNRLFAAHRLTEEATETLNSKTPETTPLGKTYLAQMNGLAATIKRSGKYSPDGSNATMVLDWMKTQGVTGYAKNMNAAGQEIFNRLSVLPNHARVEMPTRVAIRALYDQTSDKMLGAKFGYGPMLEGVSASAATMIQLKNSDPQRYKAWEASMPPNAPILAAIKMQEQGFGPAETLRGIANPEKEYVESSIGPEEDDLNRMLQTAYGSWNYASKGVKTTDEDAGTWRELHKRLQPNDPQPEPTQPAATPATATAPITPTPEPTVPTRGGPARAGEPKF